VGKGIYLGTLGMCWVVHSSVYYRIRKLRKGLTRLLRNKAMDQTSFWYVVSRCNSSTNSNKVLFNTRIHSNTEMTHRSIKAYNRTDR
jgi:hypothetical protein